MLLQREFIRDCLITLYFKQTRVWNILENQQQSEFWIFTDSKFSREIHSNNCALTMSMVKQREKERK